VIKPLVDDYGHPNAPGVSPWWALVPVLGWLYLGMASLLRCRKIEADIIRRLEARDAAEVEACWQGLDYDAEVRASIERIIRMRAWTDGCRFHPEDPWWLIGNVKTGDLCEQEIVMDIEELLGLDRDDGRLEAIHQRTFLEVIRYFTEVQTEASRARRR